MSIILGGGVTGLSAGAISNMRVFEKNDYAGGICSSYEKEGYRFEYGGGHWIFGGDSVVLNFLDNIVDMKNYKRNAGIYFKEYGIVPYPIQYNLSYLGEEVSENVLHDLTTESNIEVNDFGSWLKDRFGESLYSIFFYPFNVKYTDCMLHEIAPQDPYKSPVDMEKVISGCFSNNKESGYNVTFRYPEKGLSHLVSKIEKECNIFYNSKIIDIDVDNKKVYFEDGFPIYYDKILSTIPLNEMVDIVGLDKEQRLPYTSVLVLNIGAEKGDSCPDNHWLYIPDMDSRFHRVGFYSNVEKGFLPENKKDKVSLYVEHSFRGSNNYQDIPVDGLVEDTVKRLQNWDWIGDVDVLDPTWIDVAYTYEYPNSNWKERAISKLEEYDIYQIGRYGRWNFQGIAKSIKEGLMAGSAFQIRG